LGRRHDHLEAQRGNRQCHPLAIAAANLGKQFVGIEIEPKFFDLACKRIENAQRQEKLFA